MVRFPEIFRASFMAASIASAPAIDKKEFADGSRADLFEREQKPGPCGKVGKAGIGIMHDFFGLLNNGPGNAADARVPGL